MGVTGYDIYRNNVVIQSGVTGTTYVDSSATAATTYTYTVKARDAAGNTSDASNSVQLTTPSGTSGGITTTFGPTADARVEQANPTTNVGTSSTLGADQSSTAQIESYLTFNVGGLTGPVSSAKLRLRTTTGSSSPTTNGPAVYGVTGNSWGESTVNWNNRPAAASTPTANAGALAADTMVEYDVTSLVTANGTYGFKLVPDSTDGTSFNSRQGTDPNKRPQLVVTTAS